MSNQQKLTFVIPEELAGTRLDLALAKLLPDYSRSRIKSWLISDQITLDGNIHLPKYKVQGAENIVVLVEEAPETSWQAQELPLDIVYEDDDLMVINKPAGLVVHPAAGNPDSTLVNALLHHRPTLEQLPRAGLIHRLDKETSGLLIIAGSLKAHTHLIRALQNREIKREYQAVAQGNFTGGGKVDAPIGRHPRQRIKMAIVESGKPAVTHYRLIKRFPHYTHLRLMLETGRTHQIRVHMAHIHHSLIGDPVYGGRLKIPKAASPLLLETLRQFKRQALHADRLVFEHPVSQEEKTFTCPVPEDMEALLEVLSDEKNN